MRKTINIPKGWKKVALEDLFDFKKGQGLSKEKIDVDGKYPCLLYGELYTTYPEVISHVMSHTNVVEGIPSLVGDILIPASTTTSALDVAIATAIDIDNVLLGGDVNILRKRNKKLNPHFFAYLLRHYENINLARFAQGSTIIHLYGRHIRTHNVSIPLDELEQEKIAKVLMKTDETIQKIRKTLEKYERLRLGILQDLFRYGIDERGRIRKEETHSFKPTVLGRIPVEWKIQPLRELLLSNPRNGIYKPASEIGRGILLIGQTSFTNFGTLDFSLARRAVIAKKEYETFALKRNDLLVSRVFATAEGVGRPILIGDDLPEPAVYESNMLKLSVNQELVASELLYHELRTYAVRKIILAEINSSNQSSINQQALNRLPVAVPPMGEQKRILARLKVQERLIERETATLKKTVRVKEGLVRDLLSGDVSVLV